MTLTKMAERLTNEMMTELSTQLPPGCIERGVGTIALLKEIPIAAAASDRGVLSEATVRNLTVEAADQVKSDPGMGNKLDRTAYLKQLKPSRTAHARTATIALLSATLPALDSKYLENWRLHLNDLEDNKNNDFAGYRYTSGRILAHLVCAGLSTEIIRRSLHFLRMDTVEYKASDIVEDFAKRLERGPKPVKILLFLEQTFSLSALGVHWMTGSEVRAWAEQNDLKQALPDHFHGAIPVTGYAWDKWQLREMATTVRASLIDRAQAITGDELKISLAAVVDAFEGTVVLDVRDDNHPRIARYQLPALTLGTTDSSQPLEVATDFYTAAVRANAQATRATLLWAALEVVFSEPGVDNVECASHAADLAAFRQTRRLVGISMQMLTDHRGDPAYAAKAVGLSGEVEYSVFIAYLQEANYSGIQSVQCRSLITHAATRLTCRGMVTYRDSIFVQLRHLYRQRNLAVHGGITDSPLMAAISLLAEPTVAAAINQLSSTNARTRDEILLQTGTDALLIDRIRAEADDKEQKSDRVLSHAELFAYSIHPATAESVAAGA